MSLLKEMRSDSSGDVVDLALDSAHDEIIRKAKSKVANWPTSKRPWERMRDGEYGLCESCEKAIHLPVAGNPLRHACIQCQREAEKEGTAGWGRAWVLGGAQDTLFGDIELDVS